MHTRTGVINLKHMTPKEFYRAYYKFAVESELKTKVPALFTMAQAALESGWGARAKGNNLFGIKDTDGINGNEQSFMTTEYNKKKGVYVKLKQWFRLYRTPAESFIDHGKFLLTQPRYHKAFFFVTDVYAFAREIAAAGYATDLQYYNKIVGVIQSVERAARQ